DFGLTVASSRVAVRGPWCAVPPGGSARPRTPHPRAHKRQSQISASYVGSHMHSHSQSKFLFTPQRAHALLCSARAHAARAGLGSCTLLLLGGLSACSGQASDADQPLGTTSEALSRGHDFSGSDLSRSAARGERLFDQPFAHTNGRSCATCH